ncbi:YigZ family protein [Gracilibacillus thailandensis]|uniref:YigZ family protein n=1 Tax=Gracilibacillus thailandensis TaxID=563735 RepID=A0A6N7QY71_9BACI|nr:YigZ family protein [Gracilibacillus thailandensis]MRI67008.1 YigZ family protein [Gracilibacillus thailandensis]
MLNHYFTVKLEGSDEQVIQKSRFIGYVKRVTTEDEAQQFIQAIKKKHADATHNCSAYMIGEHDQIQKANDDGEPNGTAGVPILEVLKKRQLKDTAVVVTRYFGGIKLGAGGLIRAYSSTTSLAINTTGVVERKRMKKFFVTVDYTLLGKLENELRQSDYLLEETEYLDKVTFHVRTLVGEEAGFSDWITDLTSGNVELKEGENSYIEVDVSTE